jgi:hypothetical protein
MATVLAEIKEIPINDDDSKIVINDKETDSGYKMYENLRDPFTPPAEFVNKGQM